MARALSSFDYVAAWVLPYTTWPRRKYNYVLVSRESAGPDRGTWDALGGKKDPGERHPVVTASREAAEEGLGLIFADPVAARSYIDVPVGNTRVAIANESKRAVIYLTYVHHSVLESAVKGFNQARAKLGGEKDGLAWVREDRLEKAIGESKPRETVKVIANVLQPDGTLAGEEITLRPILVSLLRSYYAGDSNYQLGKDKRIRFYAY